MPSTDNVKVDYHFDGFELDTINFPHDKDRLYIHKIDNHVVKEAARYIKAESLDLSWVYLEYTDDMGHKYGDSEKFYNSIKVLDNQVGKLTEAIQYRKENFNENWDIFITTDHGRDAKKGHSHGKQSDREREIWIITNVKNVNSYFLSSNPGIVDLAPTILRSLNLTPPSTELNEQDGVPLTGVISVSNAKGKLNNNTLNLAWKSFNPKERLKIYISTTNNFRKGGKDAYKCIAKVKSKKEKIRWNLNKYPSNFYKILIKGKYNTVNTWVKK